jgi:hypothetical protein
MRSPTTGADSIAAILFRIFTPAYSKRRNEIRIQTSKSVISSKARQSRRNTAQPGLPAHRARN